MFFWGAPRIRFSNATMEEATHEFTEWGISAYPGRGVEGKIERMCTKCGYRNYKVLPMYSSLDSSLDIRDSYYSYRFGSGVPYSDVFEWITLEVDRYVRQKADFSKPVSENVKIFCTMVSAYDYSDKFFDGGLYSYLGDRYYGPRCFRFIEGVKGDRFGINVFGWREENDSPHTYFADDVSFAFEAFYFATEDREVAQAIWHVVDLANISGRDKVTDAKLKSFGFNKVERSGSSVTMEIKGIRVIWEWGADINGDNFYFSKID